MTQPIGIVELQELVLPALANHHGTLFAGQGLQLMAKAAFLAARSLAQREVVMAAVSRVDFVAPAPVGHGLTLRAWVSRVGRSSMTVCVTGLADLPGTPPEEVHKDPLQSSLPCSACGLGRSAALSSLSIATAIDCERRLAPHPDPHPSHSARAQQKVLEGLFGMVAVDAKGRPVSLDCAYLNQETPL